MKLKHLFFLPLALMLGAGCIKHNDSDTTITTPIGNYSGPFLRIHQNAATGKKDTIKGNISLKLDKTGFQLTGDTTRHAASFGDYAYDGSVFFFADKTDTITNTKIHLNGYYRYGYNGQQLQLQKLSGDTLGILYDLKKD